MPQFRGRTRRSGRTVLRDSDEQVAEDSRMQKALVQPSVQKLETSTLAWAVWSVVAAFGTYFCMYAFRKPFTAASYLDSKVWNIDEKTVLITAQVLGYMLSKFIGI